jgi:hypothetical protein
MPEDKNPFPEYFRKLVTLSALGLETIGLIALFYGVNHNIQTLKDIGYFITIGSAVYASAALIAVHLAEKSNQD